MDGQDRRERVRSFVLGGLVGASAAALTAARRRPRRGSQRRPAPSGLAAFEGAPCYREVVEAEERASS